MSPKGSRCIFVVFVWGFSLKNTEHINIISFILVCKCADTSIVVIYLWISDISLYMVINPILSASEFPHFFPATEFALDELCPPDVEAEDETMDCT